MNPYRSLSSEPAPSSLLYSICTIVTSLDEYAVMKKSFEDCRFTDGCEYIIADNTQGNSFDAYHAISRFMRESRGKYLVVVHQDVRCIDSKEQLTGCLDKLSALDTRWAVCGNSGAKGYHQDILYINNAGKIVEHANLPTRVHSLDENLLIIRNDTGMTISSDLTGFHLYGTDLCLIADFLGYTSYVIPFMVKHLSHGNLKDLNKHIAQFTAGYGRKLRSRYIQTTCTRFYLSSSPGKNKFYNSSFVFFFVKALKRLNLFGKRLSKGDPHKKTVRFE